MDIKKLLITSSKTLIFLVCWLLIAVIIPIPEDMEVSMWRLLAELYPFIGVVFITYIFCRIEDNSIHIKFWPSYKTDILLAVLAGIIWIGVPLIVIKFTDTYKISTYQQINNLWVWALALFLNTIAQEGLVRGYIYQMIKYNYNKRAAMFVTTIIFTILHAGAFEAGIIAVLNVISMSILMTVILEKTNALAIPVIMHFMWNFVGGMVVNVVSLASDYPNMFEISNISNSFLLGGKFGIESSWLVLILNIGLSILFYFKFDNIR